MQWLHGQRYWSWVLSWKFEAQLIRIDNWQGDWPAMFSITHCSCCCCCCLHDWITEQMEREREREKGRWIILLWGKHKKRKRDRCPAARGGEKDAFWWGGGDERLQMMKERRTWWNGVMNASVLFWSHIRYMYPHILWPSLLHAATHLHRVLHQK